MPAPFVHGLCGFRPDNGNPNTSDNGDDQSKVLGRELFVELDIPLDRPGPQNIGSALESAVATHLASVRPDLVIRSSRPATDFRQYVHLASFTNFRAARTKGRRSAGRGLKKLQRLVESLADDKERRGLGTALHDLQEGRAVQDALIDQLIKDMPEEALLKVDVTVADQVSAVPPVVHAMLSAKWSLRTDRAQDCVSQGAKLVAQRRGRMPHFAVITMEPRPSMLKILGDGSGSVDCVYHLDLPALTRTMERLNAVQRNTRQWSPYVTFRRLIDQDRLRDYDDLVKEMQRIPCRESEPDIDDRGSGPLGSP